MKNETHTSDLPENFTPSVIEMAFDTLSTLKDYSAVLEGLSIKASELVGQAEFQEKLLNLLEGIQTFADSIVQVKTVLNLESRPVIKNLESDLASILKDLMESQAKGDLDYKKNLLQTHLPANLIQWRATGLPSIEQSKDC